MQGLSLSNNSSYCDFRHISTNMMDGYALHEVVFDTTGNPIDFRYLYVNPAYEKITGFKFSCLANKTISDVFSPPDSKQVSFLREAVIKGKEMCYEDYCHKHDRHFYVKIWTPTVGLLSCLFRDTTDTKFTESKPIEKIDRNRLFLQIETEGLFILSPEGCFLEVNRGLCQMSGYSSAELQGAHLSKLQAGGVEAVNARLKKIMMNGKLCYETRYCCRDGREVDVEVSAQHFPDEAGQFVVVVRDISDRKDIVQKTAHAAHLATIGEFSAGIAHEINNPIAGVINCAELLISRKAVEEKNAHVLERIIREGNRIAKIVRGLLFLSHGSTIDTERIEIKKLLSEILIISGDQLYKDGIELQIELDEDPIVVDIDPQKLEQVILNLISNSRYALNERSKSLDTEKILNISIKRLKNSNGDRCRISVRDNGTGISPEILGKIGKPFITTKPLGIGTGLGLSISRQIVRNFYGELSVESKEGEFTKIIIELPVI